MGSIAAQLQYHCLLDYCIVADSAILTNFLYCFFFPRIYKNNLYPLLLAVRCRFPDRIFPCFSDPVLTSQLSFPDFLTFSDFPQVVFTFIITLGEPYLRVRSLPSAGRPAQPPLHRGRPVPCSSYHRSYRLRLVLPQVLQAQILPATGLRLRFFLPQFLGSNACNQCLRVSQLQPQV